MVYKKSLFWGAVLSVVLMVLPGCPPGTNPCTVEGEWLLEMGKCNDEYTYLLIMELKDDGTVECEGMSIVGEEAPTGTWLVDGTDLTITYEDPLMEGYVVTLEGTVDCSAAEGRYEEPSKKRGCWTAQKFVYL